MICSYICLGSHNFSFHKFRYKSTEVYNGDISQENRLIGIPFGFNVLVFKTSKCEEF